MNYSNTKSTFDSSLNTFSKSSRLFNTQEIRTLLEQLINPRIDRENEYDSGKCIQLSKDLSQIIKDALKSLNYERYKYVIQVVLGQCQDENLMMTCRCLWDIQTDNYISYTYSNKSIFCSVTVFGLFYL